MKLSRFCSHDLINLSLKSKTKDDAMQELKELFQYAHSVSDKDQVLEDLIEREKLGSTGVGLGIAFPHARSKAVDALTIAVGRSINGIEFGSIDKKPTHLFIVVVSPQNSHAQHLQVLASLSLLLHEKENIDYLMNASFPQEVLDLLDKK